MSWCVNATMQGLINIIRRNHMKKHLFVFFFALRKRSAALVLFLLCSLGTANTVWICNAAANRRRNRGNYHPATGQINVRDSQYGPERRYNG